MTLGRCSLTLLNATSVRTPLCALWMQMRMGMMFYWLVADASLFFANNMKELRSPVFALVIL